jgi:small subunit ribosomal protein S20
MPQIKAAKKDLRKNQRRRATNDRWRKAVRASLHAVRDALAANDTSAAAAAFLKAQSVLDRAARHHILHDRKAARVKARLSREVQKLT